MKMQGTTVVPSANKRIALFAALVGSLAGAALSHQLVERVAEFPVLGC